ncbi:MAG: hypothetical protein RIS52_1958 [Pseudomonadota bacterium]|jgi:polyisoprenoid-binding protein YceI
MHALRTTLFAAGLAASSVALSQTFTAVPSGSYIVDQSRSQVIAKVGYLGLGTKTVTFPKMSGALGYDAQAPQAIKLDVNIDATALQSGSSWDEEKLKGEDFFNTTIHPTILFHGTRLNMKSARSASVDGTITVRGISKPATLAVDFNSALGDINRTGRVSMTAKTKIKRSDFNMTAWSMIVSEKVTLTINVELVKR